MPIFRRDSRVAPENGRGSVQKRFFEKIKRIISRYTYPKDILNVLAKNSKNVQDTFLLMLIDEKCQNEIQPVLGVF